MTQELTVKELRSAAVAFYRKAEKETDKTKQYELLDEAYLCFSDAGETDLDLRCQKLQTGELKF